MNAPQSDLPPEPPKPQASRLQAALHLLAPGALRDSFSLNKQPLLRNSALAGIQASITSAIALPSIYLSPWSSLIGYAALGALVALFGRFAPQRRRNLVVLYCALLITLAVLVMSAASWLGAPTFVMLAMLALSCGVFFFLTISSNLGPPGALVFVFAAGAAMAPADSLETVFARTLATAVVAALACIVCAVTETFRTLPTEERPFPSETIRPMSHRLIASARITFGAALAISACVLLKAPHPAWAAMGALAVMQGAHLHISMNRAVQRLLGTCIGAVLAWLVLGLDPSVWTLIAILLVLQIGTEMIIGSNYGLGQILVTPMALLMGYLASPTTAGASMALERVMDTLLGAMIGVVVAVLFSTTDDRQFLARQRR